MPAEEKTFVTYRCDLGACQEHPESEYGGPLYTDPEYLDEALRDQDWYFEDGKNGRKYYCERGNHRVVWESDLADGDEPPEKPYLMILDPGGSDREVRLVV